MKKRKKNKKIVLTIIGLILLILFLILIIKYIYLTDDLLISKEKLKYINSEEWNNETYPKGMPAFIRAYKGNQSTHNIGKSIYYIVTELIPKYNEKMKELSIEERKEFFEKERELVLINFGIKAERDFMNLVDEILKLDSQNFELESFYINENSIKTIDSATKAVLHIKYKNCKEIKINIKALNTVQIDSSSVIYY